MGAGVAIWKHPIDFALFQRGAVAVILEAEGKAGSCLFGFSLWGNCSATVHGGLSLWQNALDFDFLLANAVRFVPVYLGFAEGVVGKAHDGDVFDFSPAASAVELSQAGNLSNRTAGGDSFDVGDVADNLKPHMMGL